VRTYLRQQEMDQSFEGNALTDAGIQKRILEILLETQERNPSGFGVHRSVMRRELNISEQSMDYHMAYLAQRRLVRLTEVPNFLWLWAKITAFGIDTLQNKVEQQWPSAQPIVKESHGEDKEDVKAGLIRRLADAFQRAHDLTKAKGGLSEKKENKVLEKLNLLEEELSKKEPDAGEIQETWQWLKKNADWVEPALRQVVLEIVILALE